MHYLGLSILLLSAVAISLSNPLQGTIDTRKLSTILQEGVRSKDIQTLYYSLKGLKQLNANIPDICQEIKSSKYDSKNIEQVFYVANAAALSGCVNYLSPEILGAATRVLDKKDASISELYHAVYTMKALGKGAVMNKDESLKNLIQLLKKDDSPANYAYVFTLCEHIGCQAWTTTHAEGVLLAADESDGKALHFEGGLPVTAQLLSTIVRSYKAEKKPSALSSEKKAKFGEYLLSRRSVNSPRGAAALLEGATAIAEDDPTIAIVIKGKKYITAESDSLEVSVSDILGRPIKSLKPDEVIAQSGTRLSDDVVVLSKQPLTQKDPTTFVLNLSKAKAHTGLYKLVLSAGSKTVNVNIAVLSEMQVSSIEIGVGDVDGTTTPKLTTVAYPNKLTEVLQADHLQKVTLKLAVRDKLNKPLLVQQAFVRIASESGHEAIFVAEPDNTKTYKVELNVGAIGQHIKYISGRYSISVLLGDNAVASPLAWDIGDVVFNLGKDAVAAGVRARAAVGPLPQIAHSFRAPEPRPARLVSDVFALACAAPLALLLALWAALHVNLRNLPTAPSAIIFHLSLAASLGLYGFLWLKLSMFETIRYLIPLAGITFLSGHRLLRTLVQNKSQ